MTGPNTDAENTTAFHDTDLTPTMNFLVKITIGGAVVAIVLGCVVVRLIVLVLTGE